MLTLFVYETPRMLWLFVVRSDLRLFFLMSKNAVCVAAKNSGWCFWTSQGAASSVNPHVYLHRCSASFCNFLLSRLTQWFVYAASAFAES